MKWVFINGVLINMHYVAGIRVSELEEPEEEFGLFFTDHQGGETCVFHGSEVEVNRKFNQIKEFLPLEWC